MSFCVHPSSDGTTATFCATVMCANRPTAWMAYPIWRRSSTASTSATLRPLTDTLPALVGTNRFVTRRRVDFPQPDGPSKTTSSPGATSNDTSSTAARSAPGYATRTRSNRIAAPLSARALRRKAAATSAGSWPPSTAAFIRWAARSVIFGCNPVEHAFDPRLGDERRPAHDRRDVVGRPEVAVVAQNDEIVARDCAVGRERAGNVGLSGKQGLILQCDVVRSDVGET